MYKFSYRIVKGKNLIPVSKNSFIKHIQANNGDIYEFKRIGNITYYWGEDGKIIAERLEYPE